MGYTQVGEKFRADTGFVPEARLPQAAAPLLPRLAARSVAWIRRFSPHVTWNAYYGFDGRVQTSRGHYHFLEIQPQRGGRFGMRYDYEQDQPDSPFTIFRGPDGETVVIPPRSVRVGAVDTRLDRQPRGDRLLRRALHVGGLLRRHHQRL